MLGTFGPQWSLQLIDWPPERRVSAKLEGEAISLVLTD
jgi:hypothetical protein